MVGERLSVVHHSGYGLFVLEGLPPSGRGTGDLPSNSLLSLDDVAGPGSWEVLGGRQYGPFGIEIEVLDADPGPPSSTWEDAVEVSVVCSGELAVADLENGPEDWLTLPAGDHRMRVCARGRSEPEPEDERDLDDEDDDDEDMDDEEPVEHYLVQLWPDDARPGVVLRDTGTPPLRTE